MKAERNKDEKKNYKYCFVVGYGGWAAADWGTGGQ